MMIVVTLDTKSASMALVVVPCPREEEEKSYPGGTTVVRMFGDAETMIGEYILMHGKTIYGVKLVKMFLHQLWGAEGVKQCIGPQYNHRSINSRVSSVVVVVVIQFKYV